jgi:hypothetical protein
MKLKRAAIAAILLAVSAVRAQDAVPPLAVRKDALRPGWFFVGVVPGVGTDVPILVELRSGSESAAVRRFRSPHPRSLDLCSLLRSAGLAGQAGPLYLHVSRGPASFRFSVPYDGKLCTSDAAPPPTEVATSTSSSSGLAPLVLTLPPPPEPAASEPATPVVAQAVPVPTPQPAASVAAAPATPTRSTPTRSSAPPPTPARTIVAVSQRATPAIEPAAPQQPEAVAAAAGPSAADRGLTKENFDGLNAFLLRDAKLGTNDIRFVLRFKRPVNIDGVESVVFLRARIVKGRSSEFLDRGQENFLDPADDPQSTLAISTTVPMGLALETAGVNHVVTVEIQVGTDPALAVFEGRVGIQRGLEK